MINADIAGLERFGAVEVLVDDISHLILHIQYGRVQVQMYIHCRRDAQRVATIITRI